MKAGRRASLSLANISEGRPLRFGMPVGSYPPGMGSESFCLTGAQTHHRELHVITVRRLSLLRRRRIVSPALPRRKSLNQPRSFMKFNPPADVDFWYLVATGTCRRAPSRSCADAYAIMQWV